MRHLINALAILFFCILGIGASCDVKPVNPGPVVIGGAPSTGGASAVGGVSQGGSVATGGTTAEGGSSTGTTSTVATCPEFVEPTCAASGAILSPERKAELRKRLTGWRPSPDKAKVRKWRPSYSILPVCSRFWTPNNAMPFSQRRGSCTGNAVAGVLSTQPFQGRLTQDDADERIYPLATTLDPFPGAWPPEDTGSLGSSAWLAAMKLGYTDIPSTPISSLEELQSALQKTSCFVGVDWYNAMMEPTRCGELVASGGIAGGHEAQVIGINIQTKKVWIRNSWDWSWGLARGNELGGYAYFSFGTLQKLLNAGGELDCPARPPASAAVGF